ncbi:metalloprotease [Tautonia rosea]|uniref:metalloprotease n=1 Tax=Tautonia rosea TaxID=2728037 RepID=UPI00147560DC|nr:site-2 protease family protein [Tautonia rosea]
MLMGRPDTTPYDLRFQLLGVPVRIHPAFWIVGLMLGFDQTDPKRTLVWVAVLFVSILWHEMGHAMAAVWNGLRPSVVLYWMGGLCFSERDRLGIGGNIAVILGGPGAGFVLGLLTVMIGAGVGGLTLQDNLALFGLGSGSIREAISKFNSPYVLSFYYSMLFFNFGWTLVNLLPIWSLDGGQFLAQVLTSRHPYRGMQQTYTVGMIAAGLVALWAFSADQTFLAIFFALFAFSNYQGRRALQQQGGYGSFDVDRGDWWKRGR